MSNASQPKIECSRVPFRVLRENSANSFENFSTQSSNTSTTKPSISLPASLSLTPEPSFYNEPEQMIAHRHSILAALPLPAELSADDTLSPIVIPAPFTLHEFLGNTTGVSFTITNKS